MSTDADRHPFLRHPRRTLLVLSWPVLLSLIAEPLTGLVDTAFIARLGSAPLASLGVAVTLVSSIFWVFNFLGIGAQTEVARGLGTADPDRSRRVTSLAMALGLIFGAAVALVAWPASNGLVDLMGARPEASEGAAVYLRIRLLGGPAVLLSHAAFGALRGLQDMRTPLWIVIATNAINLGLDPLLIFGAGPLPALGLAGAAWASTFAHWVGAVLALAAASRRLGLTTRLHPAEALGLLVVGRDLFFRTGGLLLFIALATRAANRMGTDTGAAHQVIRQVWTFTAFLLDAYAHTAQSLVGYFLAASRRDVARRVAAVACLWSAATGVALALAMLILTSASMALLVPESARTAFTSAWWLAAAFQPLNALSFATDGIHWGTRDYRYLRNAMLLATGIGSGLLLALDGRPGFDLQAVWMVTGLWIVVRAAFGMARIWPGIGGGPLSAPRG